MPKKSHFFPLKFAHIIKKQYFCTPFDTYSNMKNSWKTALRDIWHNYRSEIWFALVLYICTFLGHWFTRYLPFDLVEDVILPVQHGANIAVCVIGAWLLFHHSDGLRLRRASGYALAAWGLADAALLVQDFAFNQHVLRIGSEELDAYTLFFCDFLAWILLVYPTEALRPRWLNWKRSLLQLLPLAVLVALDYVIPLDLRWFIALYPVLLIVQLLTHVNSYRKWCEENYSSMEQIDVQWIVRYLIMVLVIGVSYIYIALSTNPGRVVTQNTLLFFVFAYSIDHILFRKDPWENMVASEETEMQVADGEQSDLSAEAESLQQWMESEKPYVNPDFKLMDLRAVLPMNRTYLSQFINNTYGCPFYEFVNNYRVEEAKRLMYECPELKMADIATRAGFSSQSTFTKIFTKKTGLTPSEWGKKFSCA